MCVTDACDSIAPGQLSSQQIVPSQRPAVPLAWLPQLW